LNGKAIFRAPEAEPYLKLHGIFRIPGGQAVLVSQNCGGSGCQVDPLSFVLLAKHAKSQVLTQVDFNSETHSIRASEKSGTVIVDLGYYRQKKKVAVLDSEYLSIALKDVPVREMPDDQCKSLYNAADACVRDHTSSIGCFDYSTADFASGGFSGSNAEVWGVRIASHFPGFNRNGFVATCATACRSGKLESYAAFRMLTCTAPPP